MTRGPHIPNEEPAKGPTARRLWLPPLRTRQEWRAVLAARDDDALEDDEGNVPDVSRRLERLPLLFEPIGRVERLARELTTIVRAGYDHRGLLLSNYSASIPDRRRAFAAAATPTRRRVREPHQGGLALIGASGCGKTVSAIRILSTWKQVAEHELDGPGRPVFKQLVWIVIDASASGSVKALCFAILAEVDAALGTDYLRDVRGRSTELVIQRMREVVDHHALGLIAIDELQALRGRGVVQAAVVDTLVRLVNTLGVPLLAIGTPAMLDVLQRETRLLRRLGANDHRWNPLPNEKAFEELAKALVTRGMAMPLLWSNSLRDDLHEWSQGLPSLLASLLVRSQREVLADGRAAVLRSDLEAVVNSWPTGIHRMREAMRQQHAELNRLEWPNSDDGLRDITFL